jgi:WD40 repeat protein
LVFKILLSKGTCFKDEVVHSLSGAHTTPVNCLLALSNGDLASGGNDGVIAIWNLDSSELKFTLKDEGGVVKGLIEMSNDNIVSWSKHGITFWHLRARKLERHFQLEFPVYSLALLSDGNLALGSIDIKIFNPISGQSLRKIKPDLGDVLCLLTLPDSQLACSCQQDNDAYLTVLSAKTGKTLTTEHIGYGASLSLVLLNERLFAVGTKYGYRNDCSLKIFDAQTGDMLRCLSRTSSGILGLVVLKNGSHILSWCVNKTVQVWDVETGECLSNARDHALKSLVASKSSSYVASLASGESKINVWAGFLSYVK